MITLCEFFVPVLSQELNDEDRLLDLRKGEYVLAKA